MGEYKVDLTVFFLIVFTQDGWIELEENTFYYLEISVWDKKKKW